MMRLIKDFILPALLILFILGSVGIAHGQDESVCASVYPCLENGEIMPQFNSEGYCGDQYRLICSKVKASLMADELVSCQNENTSLRNSEAKLAKTIRNLRRQLKDAK